MNRFVAAAAMGATGLLIACLGRQPASDRALRPSAEPSLEPPTVDAAPTPTAPSASAASASASAASASASAASATAASATAASPPAASASASTSSHNLAPSPPSPCAMSPSTGSERVLLRSSGGGSGYELELQSPRGLSARGLPLWLRLGNFELRLARESPTVGEYGAVFQISRTDFDSIPDGAELVVVSSQKGGGRSLGRLDKSALCIR